MSVMPSLPETEKWCLQKCPICGRENYMVVRGDIEIDGRHEVYPDIGYSFCNCYNIFYTTHCGYEHPLKQLADIFHNMPSVKEGQFILADPFFINWDNVYEFKHWKVRENVVIWDIDSFCRAAKEIGFAISAVERELEPESNYPQTTMVVLGRAEPELRTCVKAAKELLKGKSVKIAEVGVRKGNHASMILDNWLEIEKFYLIDGWQAYETFPNQINQNHIKDEVIDRFEKNEKVKIIVSDSSAGAKTFENESLDFVYIDADHTYEAVKLDVKAWLPKIKKGGIIGGHDYNYQMDAVKNAVNDIFGADKVNHGVNSNSLEDWWVYL